MDLLKELLEKSWSADTCYPPLKGRWTKDNPSLGQCLVTALVVQDCFGGDLLYCKHSDHYWNMLPDGEVDLTRGQFQKGTRICLDEVQPRDVALESQIARENLVLERYLLLKNNIDKTLLGRVNGPCPL